MSSISSKPIAVFDFDHTLTDRDSLLPFLFFAQGFWKTLYFLFLLIPSFIGYLIGLLSRQEIKERILTRFFGGDAFKEMQALGEYYAREQLDHYLKPEAIRRLVWHQSLGHRCLLVSASPEFYLVPWAKRHGFEAVLASILDVSSDGTMTGKLVGLNCWGPEKERRFLAYLAEVDGEPLNVDQLYVYGDSRGDQEMLALAHHPFYRIFEETDKKSM